MRARRPMSDVAMFISVVLLAVVLGACLAFVAFARAFSMLARMQRTGSPDVPQRVEDDGSAIRSPSAEGAAQARVTRDAISRGGEMIMAAAKERGTLMSKAEAERDAALMLGEAPLGGAR